MQNIICKTCGSHFSYNNEELNLFNKWGFGPIPLCFECDQKRRLCFRNERSLYSRKCDATGEKIVSIYSEDKPYKVYMSEYWYGDKWDAMEFGMDFDFNRTFFEQMKELQLKVPRVALSNARNENSEYCNMTVGNKNCYLLFGGDFNEDCMYGTLSMHNIKTFDFDYSNDNELCYMLCDCINCYYSFFAFDSKNCNNCYFISDCTSCNECILCTNLVNKSFCINNVQYSKDEYFLKKEGFINGSYDIQRKNFEVLKLLRKKRIVKYSHIVSCQNSSGDYLKNCKNCHNVYDASDSEDLTNVIFASKTKDCFMSSLLGDGTELGYNTIACLASVNTKFSFFSLFSSNTEYCEFSISSHDLFGCIGLKNKKNCILNKQYSEEEFKSFREKIINHMKNTGEWGNYFPKDYSCFGYNETTANNYFPLEREQILKEGFKWFDMKERYFIPQKIHVPDDITQVGDDICNEVLECDDCGKNFKIQEAEYRYYLNLNLPIPRKCSECRHLERMNLRNPRRLWDRKCDKCGIDVKSSYNPNRQEKIYCEKCYLEAVF